MEQNKDRKIVDKKEKPKEITQEERKRMRESRGIGWMLDVSAIIYEKNGNKYDNREYP